MAQLTDWLKLMVAEIDRKREEAERAREEEAARAAATPAASSAKKKDTARVPEKAAHS